MKKFIVLFSVLLVTACQSTTTPPKPTGVWQWDNVDVKAKERSGELTNAQASHQFTIEKSKCRIEGLKIPTPSPSCTQPPRQDCSHLTGFSKGFCQGYTPQPRCDYSSVNAATDAQFEVYNSCMNVAGWTRRWVTNSEINKNKDKNKDDEDIEDIFNSIPELVDWRDNDYEKWNLAKKIDNELIDNKKYQSLTVRERLTLVVSKVKSVM